MAEPRSEVLSDRITQCMNQRRLVAAVMATFQFDPGFFELEVLPLLLPDVPYSHQPHVRRAQLEDALRRVKDGVTVYYGSGGLITHESRHLNYQAIPIRQSRGCFHAKNLFLLVEPSLPEDASPHPRTLLFVTLSANLTKSGWWENVEVCQVEEIEQGEPSRLRDDLLEFLRDLERKARGSKTVGTTPLRTILHFLKGVQQIPQKSKNGALYPHFYHGSEPVVDFIRRVAGKQVEGMSLEVISPFFDQGPPEKTPLKGLVERLKPREVRVFRPRDEKAPLSEEFYDWVCSLDAPNRPVKWGCLPATLLQNGSLANAAPRFVHAKVYRFFSKSPKREICFVGSVNLTNAGHSGKVNVETGILVDLVPPTRPDFWLEATSQRPASFEPKPAPDEEELVAPDIPLILRYNWRTEAATAFWDAPRPSGPLQLESRGVPLGKVDKLAAREDCDLDKKTAARLAECLKSTSFVTVTPEGEASGIVMVLEEERALKPSIALELTLAEILRYWSSLTPEQRARVIEATACPAVAGSVAPLVPAEEDFFTRFAGYFHAFNSVKRDVEKAIDEGKPQHAAARLFGKGYDSLSKLVELAEVEEKDDVNRYVLGMCARQLLRDFKKSQFLADYKDQKTDLKRKLGVFLRGVRTRLIEQDPKGMPDFLDWFDDWFLERAKPLEEVTI